jgi:hypothetical protein
MTTSQPTTVTEVATYLNLASRRINAPTALASKTATKHHLQNVRDAAFFSMATLNLPVTTSNAGGYNDARLD